METLSADMSDFQDSLIDLFFDSESQKYNALEAQRGKFLNSADNVIDHGSMMQYDPSKDWTRTAKAMIPPSTREVRMAAVVTSAGAIADNGVSGFFGFMKNQLELKLGLRDAEHIRPTRTSKCLSN